MNLDGVDYYACDVCGKLVADDNCHIFHDDDCPNRLAHMTGHWKTDCVCDNRAHPECCPACAPWIICCEWMGRWTLWWSGSKAGWKIRQDAAHVYADKYRALAAIERMKSEERATDIRAVPLSIAKEMIK